MILAGLYEFDEIEKSVWSYGEQWSIEDREVTQKFGYPIEESQNSHRMFPLLLGWLAVKFLAWKRLETNVKRISYLNLMSTQHGAIWFLYVVTSRIVDWEFFRWTSAYKSSIYVGVKFVLWTDCRFIHHSNDVIKLSYRLKIKKPVVLCSIHRT